MFLECLGELPVAVQMVTAQAEQQVVGNFWDVEDVAVGINTIYIDAITCLLGVLGGSWEHFNSGAGS
jgi:hypothetical protein